MATIRKEFRVESDAARVWDALRDFGAVDRKLAAGFVRACHVEEGGNIRVVTFANGMQVREQLVGIDDKIRRLAYAVVGGTAQHHNASAEIVDLGDGSCRFVWTTDVLPESMAPRIEQMMEAGAAAMKACLERSGEGAASP